MIVFEIVEQSNCPLYKVGECFTLTERAVRCPPKKEACLILVREMTELLFEFLQRKSTDPSDITVSIYTCSGCSGLIKFRQRTQIPDAKKKSGLIRGEVVDKRMRSLIENSEFFRALPKESAEIFIASCKELDLDPKGVLIHKGEYNQNLYLILEGILTVENDNVIVAECGRGDLCGEMSYLGTGIATSTVRAMTKVKVLAISGEEFDNLFGENAAVQSYMAKLLASRLQRANIARSQDFASTMSGQLGEIGPAELFQIFHMHQKTGVLLFQLHKGEARVSFREGCIINASYGALGNQDAIFSILAEKKGQYRFTVGLTPQEMKAAEIGDFMMLLMEGVKRIDEEISDD
ncbi:MAG: DUF4388 domain-containing protein [Desulfobulbaceae bacterium]|nr:MAG: DUF4388 domain-containing protein [Desulfobulbaceae bacterium]